MRRQLLLALSFIFLLACSDEPASDSSHLSPGASPQQGDAALVFSETKLNLGKHQSGVILDVAFSFDVQGGEVRINSLEKSCGCLQPQLYANGIFQSLPATLPAGSTGEVRAKFATAGFSGEKRASITLRGVGFDFPKVLHMQAQLKQLFQLQPEKLLLGAFDANQEERHEVRVVGQQPFRLTETRAAGVGIRVEGVPSQELALEQSFVVILEPDQEEGVHTHFVEIQTSLNRSVICPVRYEKTGLLWFQPSSRLMLGALHAGVPIEAAVDVGVREGWLEKPEVHLLGLEEGTIDCVTLVDGSRYRVLLRHPLPVGFPSGPLKGQLEFRLNHQIDDERQEMRRSLPVVGMVVSSK